MHEKSLKNEKYCSATKDGDNKNSILVEQFLCYSLIQVFYVSKLF